MALADQIHRDMIAAMKEKAELRLSTLRMMKSAIKNKEIELIHALSDQEAQQVLATLIKQREDAATQFTAGGRAELAAKEKAEIEIIEAYLPKALSAAEVEAGVREAITATGVTAIKDMGTVMKAAMAGFQSRQQRVDGKQVSETVKRLLAGG